MHRYRLPVALLAISLALPLGAASWSSHGGSEPDYPQDVASSFMWADPDTDPNPSVQKVYFNVVLGQQWDGVNANAGMLKSRVITAGFQAPIAFLGVWKDCNGDGYIGAAESAVLEYSSTLLVGPWDTGICPPGTAFNANGWVSEFRWIGPEDVRAAGNSVPRMINDTGSFVWGDPGLPGGGASLGCFVNPQTGTFSSTGAMISYVDCLADSTIADSARDVNQAIVDATGVDPGLAYDDRPECDTTHPTYVSTHIWESHPRCPSGQNGLYERNDTRQEPAFTLWDCSRPTGTADVRDPTSADGRGSLSGVHQGTVHVNITDERGSYATVPAVDPTTPPGQNDIHDGVNHTMWGTHHCDREDNSRAFLNGAPYATPEDDVGSPEAQRDSTFYFYFQTNYAGQNTRRGCAGLNTAAGPVGPCSPPVGSEPPLHPDTPQGAGVHYPFPAQGLGPIWWSPISSTNTPPNLRDDLSPSGPRYYTFYARISLASQLGLTLPGGSGIYGDEWCHGVLDGEVNGFDCDPDHWWQPSFGASAMPRQAGRDIGQVPGAVYQLRDTDCFDGSLASEQAPGVGLGLTWLSDVGPCANYQP